MPTEIDPGFAPGAIRRVVIISIVLIIFGIGIFPMSMAAFHSGEPIPMLSRGRQIYGWEGILISFLAVIVGIGGIWAVARRRNKKA